MHCFLKLILNFFSVAYQSTDALPSLQVQRCHLCCHFHGIFHRIIIHFYNSTNYEKNCARKEKWRKRINENDGVAQLDELVFPLSRCHSNNYDQFDYHCYPCQVCFFYEIKCLTQLFLKLTQFCLSSTMNHFSGQRAQSKKCNLFLILFF